jgi:hypothetical protein
MLAKQGKVFVARHARDTQIVLDYEHWYFGVSGNDDWSDRARLGEG